MEEQMGHRRSRILLALPLLLILSGVGCPKDPYRASLQGSDDVSNGVKSAIKISASYYTSHAINDTQKAAVAGFLTTVTQCNMTFRASVIAEHNAKQVGIAAFLPIADSFVTCAEAQKSIMSDSKIYNILKAVDTAINGVSLAVASAKGGQ
jgi:hypothetical protein